jgi:hypothetical protein
MPNFPDFPLQPLSWNGKSRLLHRCILLDAEFGAMIFFSAVTVQLLPGAFAKDKTSLWINRKWRDVRVVF